MSTEQYSLTGKVIDFTLTSNKTSVSEGEEFEVTLQASGIDAFLGMEILYRIIYNDSNGVNEEDYYVVDNTKVVGETYGVFKLNSSLRSTIKIKILKDDYFEGTEYIGVSLVFRPTVTVTVAIGNTTPMPPEKVAPPKAPPPNITIEPFPAFIAEGAMANFKFTFTNIPNLYEFYYEWFDIRNGTGWEIGPKVTYHKADGNTLFVGIPTNSLGKSGVFQIRLKEFPTVKAEVKVNTGAVEDVSRVLTSGTHLVMIPSGRWYIKLVGGGGGGGNAVTKTMGTNGGDSSINMIGIISCFASGGTAGSYEGMELEQDKFFYFDVTSVYTEDGDFDGIRVHGEAKPYNGTIVIKDQNDVNIPCTLNTSNGVITGGLRGPNVSGSIFKGTITYPSGDELFFETTVDADSRERFLGRGGDATGSNALPAFVISRKQKGKDATIISYSENQPGGETVDLTPTPANSGSGGQGLCKEESLGWGNSPFGRYSWGEGMYISTYAGGGGSGGNLDLIIDLPFSDNRLPAIFVVGAAGTGSTTNNNGKPGLVVIQRA